MAQLNFFDCNTYIGRQRKSSPLAFHTTEGLLAEMDYLGIDEAVVYHATGGNGSLMQAIKGYERLHGCWVYPLHHYPGMPEPIKVVEDMLDQGVKVTRLLPSFYLLISWRTGHVASCFLLLKPIGRRCF